MINVISNIAQTYGWSNFKLTDYRIQDELDLTERDKPKIHLEFDYSDICAVLVTSCDYYDNDFEFYGCGSVNMTEDPYEINILASESCFAEVKNAIDIISNKHS